MGNHGTGPRERSSESAEEAQSEVHPIPKFVQILGGKMKSDIGVILKGKRIPKALARRSLWEI